MNPSRGGEGGGLLGKWRHIFMPALLVFSIGSAPLFSAPPPRGGGGKSSAPQKNAPAAQADLLAPQMQPATPDLLLKKEDAAKAGALAAYADGMIAENNGEMDKALESYQKALSLDPANSELAVKIALALARRGDASGGIEVLKDPIKAAPKEPLPYLCLSQLYARFLKKPDLALKYAQQALDLDPANVASYLALHELYVVTGQQKKAEQVLDRAANLQANDPQFWVQLGEIYARIFDLKEDGTIAPENLKRLNAIYQKALGFAKNDPEILAQVAEFYGKTRQFKDAIPLSLRVISLKADAAGDARPSPENSLSDLREKLARCYRANKQQDEAIAVFQQLIKENPMRFEAYEQLAELFEEKHDFDNALASYQQVLLLDPVHPDNYRHVAVAQAQVKKYDKAIETLTEARAKFPDLPQFTYLLAMIYSEAKQHQKAVTAFEEARHEAETAQPEMLNGMFYFSYGQVSEQAGLADKAAELLKKSIDLDPDGKTMEKPGEVYNYLGYMGVE